MHTVIFVIFVEILKAVCLMQSSRHMACRYSLYINIM